MWATLGSFVFKVFGRGAWGPFLRVLANQGRPSPVFFPPELIDQGLGFGLTGITNTFAFQGHASWALPWWAEQQLRPESDSFIPSGVNVITSNLTHRNWTALGVAGTPWKAMVDPCGMLTPKAFGSSWLPCLDWGGKTWVPSRLPAEQIEQHLKDGWRNSVVTRYHIHPDLEWRSEAEPLRQSEHEWVAWTHHLRWLGKEPIQLSFKLGLRPYNALTLGPIFRSRQKGLTWSINRQAALLLSLPPDEVWFGKDRDDPLLMQSPLGAATKGKARNGWLGGTARWEITLNPREGWSLRAEALIPRDDRRIRWRSLLPTEVKAPLPSEHQETAALNFQTPDSGLHTLVKALIHHLPAFDNGSHFAPGAFFYNHHWLRDSTFLALAHDLWGLHDQVANKESQWIRTQKLSGHFTSHSGEWDGTGQTLFTWVTHALLTGSDALLARHWRRFARGVRWIARTRRRDKTLESPHAGLLPAGLSAEHFGPNDHYFWDNFWSLAGMDRFHLALERWQAAPPAARKFAQWLQAEVEAYRDTLRAHITRLSAQHEGLLPSSPYRHPDAATVGTLAALSPLDLDLGAEITAWGATSAKYLLGHWVKNRLFYQPIIHTGGNAYLSAQLARALQCLGDPRWFELFQGILDHATSTWTWPEAIHPRTGGGCMGDGDHGWACAEVLALVRLALVREQAGAVLLLPNLPEAWWREGTLGLSGAPTMAGRLHFNLKSRPDGTATLGWELQRLGLSLPWPLKLVLPAGWEGTSDAPPATAPWGAPALALPDQGTLTLRRISVSR